jgi:hypothetical protein
MRKANAMRVQNDEPAANLVKAELLPSPESILRPGVDKALLDRIVTQRVAEIMAEKEAATLEPFFRSRQIAFEIRRLQTVPEQESWHVFFERHGCLYCHSKERIHGGCGMCVRCYPRILNEKQTIIRELLNGKG